MSRIQDDVERMRSHESVQSPVPSRDPEMLCRTAPRGRRLKVAVIGAGVAGLRAADRLLQHDVDITVLEARDRVGGRMGQSLLNGKLVDLGPNWIHGTNDNPILDLAHRTDTELHSWGERQATYDRDGSEVPREDIVEASEGFWSIIADAFKYSNEHTESIPAKEGLMNFVERKADEKLSNRDTSSVAKSRKRRLLLDEALMWGAFVAGSTSRQSLKFFWLEECIEGENPFVAGTYKKILDAIAKPVVDANGTLTLNRVISKIAFEESEKSVKITDTEGCCEAYDEVIVTSPLGWLKRNKSSFDPQLPDRLGRAIDAIGYGNLDKAYITFPRPFWNLQPSTTGGSITATRSHDIPNTTATTAPLHNTSTERSSTQTVDFNDSNDQFPGFAHWYPPTYANSTNPHAFNQQAINLAALPPAHAHPTLLFYVSGDCAKYLSDLQTSAASEADAKAKLIQFFTPYLSLLPNYNKDDPDCTPLDILATNWAADEYAGYGSYSNFQVGLEYGDKDIEVMRHGMPERRTWLAGEHTAPFVALGTVTGAWWSGDGVAGRILRCYGLEDGEGDQVGGGKGG